MRHASSLILTAVRNPSSTAALPPEDWDLLLRLGRRTSLLAYIAIGLRDAKALEEVHHRARCALESALSEVSKLQQMGSWEVNRITRALRGSGIQLVLLKGMAYFAAELPHARGRPFSDVDVLVPREQLEQAESILKESGWISIKTDDYDQHYYQEWMHELAPLRHEERETIVDLHHAIVPRTSRLKMDSKLLFPEAQKLAGTESWLLQPTDMLIHAAVHLFHDGDLGDCLRDLLDIDQMARHFSSKDSKFILQLIRRADELGAGRSIFYALRYSQQLLGTPVSNEAREEASLRRPSRLILKVMDLLVPMALLPEHPDFTTRRVSIARWCLFVRSHYLRMPWKVLVPHLLRKSRRRQKNYFELIGAER